MTADIQNTAIPAGPAQSGAAARVVRSLDGLDQLAAAWDALAGGAGSPMQQFIWARACAESYCRRGDQLHVVTVGPAGRPTAIAPLIRRRGLGRLEMLGGRELYDSRTSSTPTGRPDRRPAPWPAWDGRSACTGSRPIRPRSPHCRSPIDGGAWCCAAP